MCVSFVCLFVLFVFCFVEVIFRGSGGGVGGLCCFCLV